MTHGALWLMFNIEALAALFIFLQCFKIVLATEAGSDPHCSYSHALNDEIVLHYFTDRVLAISGLEEVCAYDFSSQGLYCRNMGGQHARCTPLVRCLGDSPC